MTAAELIEDTKAERRLTAAFDEAGRVAKRPGQTKRTTPASAKTVERKAKRCAIYGRYSVARDGKLSDRKQLADCRARADAKGFDVVGEYFDAGVSGGEGVHRPHWERLRADIRAGKVDVVIVSKIDRFTRSLSDFAEVAGEMKANGCTLISLGDDFDTSSPMGRAMLRIVLIFAELERDMIVERNAGMAKYRREQGHLNGGNVPYGYRKEGKGATATFVVEPTEAAVIRDIADRIMAGQSLRAIAADLNATGAPLPSGSKEWKAEAHRAAHWYAVNVRRVVTLPAVAALRDAHDGTDTYIPGAWAPILTVERWQAVVDELGSTKRARHIAGRQGGHVVRNLLSGLIKCERCGNALRPRRNPKSGQMRYACSAGDAGGGVRGCGGTSCGADDAERFVADALFAALAGVELAPIVLHTGDRVGELQRDIEDLNAMMEDPTTRLSVAEYGRLRQPLVDELALLTEAADRATTGSTIVGLIGSGMSIPDAWHAVDADGEPLIPIDTKRAAIREAFPSIVCRDNGRRGLVVPIADRLVLSGGDR